MQGLHHLICLSPRTHSVKDRCGGESKNGKSPKRSNRKLPFIDAANRSSSYRVFIHNGVCLYLNFIIAYQIACGNQCIGGKHCAKYPPMRA